MKRAMVAISLLVSMSGGCEEISVKTVVHRQPQLDGMMQAETRVLPPDCVPACKPPKFCDRNSRPPRCVAAVDDHVVPPPVQPPHSLQIHVTDRAADPGEGPSDDEAAPQPY